ncbi:hypothetical protein SQ11_14615 [Nitrosospira sp. NpAV]|nr:hypothetical protein SQ11_14615 [Nitrosospira sp. NpAV]
MRRTGYTLDFELGKVEEHERVLDEVLVSLSMHAMKRELKESDYLDGGALWETLPKVTQELIRNFNQIPKETRPEMLEQLRGILKKDMEGPRRLIKLFKA